MKDLKHIRNLVFKGGSIKGIAYLGALDALIQAGMTLDQIKYVSGTSAGAITAFLLAIGCGMDSIKEKMQEMDFKKILDNTGSTYTGKKIFKKAKLPGIIGVPLLLSSPKISYPLFNQYGLFNGAFLLEWLQDISEGATGIKYLTFAELHTLAANNTKYKDLYIYGSNVSTGNIQLFSHDTTPDAIVADAVRISMSIPFIFIPHYIYNKDKVNNSRVKDPGGHLYVDGGLSHNYPISTFDHTQFLDDVSFRFPEEKYEHTLKNRHDGEHKLGDNHEYIINQQTLGLCLLSKRQFGNMITRSQELNDIDGLLAFTKSIVGYYNSQQNIILHGSGNANNDRSIFINDCGIDMLEFDLSNAQKMELICAGVDAVSKYVNADPHLLVRINLEASEEKKSTIFRNDERDKVQVIVWVGKNTNIGHVALNLQWSVQNPRTGIKYSMNEYISIYPTTPIAISDMKGVEFKNSTFNKDAIIYEDPEQYEEPEIVEFYSLNVKKMHKAFRKLEESGFNFSLLSSTFFVNEKTHNCCSLCYYLLCCGGLEKLQLRSTNILTGAAVGAVFGIVGAAAAKVLEDKRIEAARRNNNTIDRAVPSVASNVFTMMLGFASGFLLSTNNDAKKILIGAGIGSIAGALWGFAQVDVLLTPFDILQRVKDAKRREEKKRVDHSASSSHVLFSDQNLQQDSTTQTINRMSQSNHSLMPPLQDINLSENKEKKSKNENTENTNSSYASYS